MKILAAFIFFLIVMYLLYRSKKRAKIREEARIEKIHGRRVENWQALLNAEPESPAESTNTGE